MNLVVAIRQVSIAIATIVCSSWLFTKDKTVFGVLILIIEIVVHFIDINLYYKHEKETTNPYISPRL